jgi:hypothetical protein
MGIFHKLFGKKSIKETDNIQKESKGVIEAAKTIVEPLIEETKIEPECPHCKFLFDEMPKRKRKCPQCKEDIYVKKENDKSFFRLVDEKEASKIDDYNTYLRREAKVKNILSEYGITENEFNKSKIEWNTKFTNETKLRDFLWGMYNKALSKNSNNLQALKMIYLHSAHFLNEEGRDTQPSLKEMKKVELQQISLNGQSINKKLKAEIAGDKNCDYGKKINGKTYSLEKALSEMPIPSGKCTNENKFCNCIYVTSIQR